MNREDIQGFLNRDWRAVEAAKGAFWARQKESLGTAAVFSIVDSLRDEIRALRPEWPSPRDRHEDLESHRVVGERIRCVDANACR
jgi:hypothetical protein